MLGARRSLSRCRPREEATRIWSTAVDLDVIPFTPFGKMEEERRLPGGWPGGILPPLESGRQDAARPAGRMPTLLIRLERVSARSPRAGVCCSSYSTFTARLNSDVRLIGVLKTSNAVRSV